MAINVTLQGHCSSPCPLSLHHILFLVLDTLFPYLLTFMLGYQHLHCTAVVAFPAVADYGLCIGHPAQRPFHAVEDVVVVNSKQRVVVRRKSGQIGLD